MIRAPDSLIIAQRTWPSPIAGSDWLPSFETIASARMTIGDAQAAYRAGTVEIATGRSIVRADGQEWVVESLYAIPRKVVRPGSKRLLGRGFISGRVA